ncbi:MAG: GNAT family N-acetyltransferase [Kofleriaceae bacterium]
MSLASRRDYHQTIEYAGVMELGGWRSVAAPSALVFVQRTPSRTFAKMQRPTRIDVDALHRLVDALAIDELFVEPALAVDLVETRATHLAYTLEDEGAYVAAFTHAGFTPTPTRWAHTKTLVLPTRGSHDELVASLDGKVRRDVPASLDTLDSHDAKVESAVRFTARGFDDLTRAELDAIAELHATWRATHAHHAYDAHFLASLRRCFGRHGALILAHLGDALVGVAHVLFVDRVTIYFDAFTAPEARESHASLGLVIEAARAGRGHGCDLVDLCAAWDERYPDLHADWKGFTAFKRRLATSEVYYPPTFVLRR